MVPTHSCMSVICGDSIQAIRSESQLFCPDWYFVNPFSFLFIHERIHDTSFPIRDTFGFIHVELACVYVCPCCIRTGSYWFVSVLHYVDGGFALLLSTSISRTSRMDTNHFRNVVRTCRMNYEFTTISKWYTNKYDYFKHQTAFVPPPPPPPPPPCTNTNDLEWVGMSPRTDKNEHEFQNCYDRIAFVLHMRDSMKEE